MLKNVSTIGVVLMTTMIVYRACTINHSKDLKAIYQRNSDDLFDEENIIRLEIFTQLHHDKTSIMSVIKPPAENFLTLVSNGRFQQMSRTIKGSNNSEQTIDSEAFNEYISHINSPEKYAQIPNDQDE